MNKPKPPADFDDDFEWTEEAFARARPADEALPADAAAALVRKPGRPKGSTKPDAKQQVTLRLDREVIERFKAGGAGWQSRINEALRKAM